MSVLGQINARSRTGFLGNQPTRKLSLEGVTASFSEDKESVLVTNLSTTGVLAETNAPLSVGEPLEILLPEGEVLAATVVWANEGIFACEFERPLSVSTIRKVELHCSSPARIDDQGANLPGGGPAAETLGERIKRLRRERGFSMVHFASCIGVSKPTLWKWENGTVFPRQHTIRVLAEALGVPELELIYGSERPAPADEQAQQSSLENLRNAIGLKKEELANIIGIPPRRIRIIIEE
ncbi:MAG: helix-turn-helix transcriptional regulator [Sphingomonadales bacterium]|nr:helix-turn-helix transcriptional regulator [Sphingomonadales bacterium]MBU3992409.1 helix-turn-helix domain-containing protein [Alphaproteobacteria bacterium]